MMNSVKFYESTPKGVGISVMTIQSQWGHLTETDLFVNGSNRNHSAPNTTDFSWIDRILSRVDVEWEGVECSSWDRGLVIEVLVSSELPTTGISFVRGCEAMDIAISPCRGYWWSVLWSVMLYSTSFCMDLSCVWESDYRISFNQERYVWYWNVIHIHSVGGIESSILGRRFKRYVSSLSSWQDRFGKNETLNTLT